MPDNNPVTESRDAYGNTIGIATGPTMTWDHVTHLCTSNCSEVHAYRQMKYAEQGSYSWWHAVGCMVTPTPCSPEDVEWDVIQRVVDLQVLYIQDGSPRSDATSDMLLSLCYQEAAKPAEVCTIQAIRTPHKA